MQRKTQIDLQRIHRDAYLEGPGTVRLLLGRRSPQHILLGNAIALSDRPEGLLTYDRDYVMTRIHDLKVPLRLSIDQGGNPRRRGP
ncbi:hypothetical protein BHE74_00014136 [Ensete ventricosum]|nr:hypothetical protein BHE74_00014136 [Ensete ventricosum]RZR92927.1 hypothetical protein BHM03_00021313 [Ensete ventricosum]